jgi:hypothetical protein
MMATRVDAPAEARLGEPLLERHERFRLLPFLGPAFVACVAYVDRATSYGTSRAAQVQTRRLGHRPRT